MRAMVGKRWSIGLAGPAGLVALVAVLCGCSGLPVQEVSDARQAIGAARAAGGDHYAPETLHAAEVLVARALDGLSTGDYGAARAAARSAKQRAILAREVALSVQTAQ